MAPAPPGLRGRRLIPGRPRPVRQLDARDRTQESSADQAAVSFDPKHASLDDLIAKDTSFKNVWGKQLETDKVWGPDGQHLYYIPNNTGERVFNWDATIFADYGIEPLSKNPTLDEIATKAKAMTGTDPKTGKQTYGYWYQGKYTVWQFLSIAHSMGANWGFSPCVTVWRSFPKGSCSPPEVSLT